MDDLTNWTEITKGLYRYVIAANVCYEIHVLYYVHKTDILSAKASLYMVGNWSDTGGNSFFERQCLLSEQPVSDCLEAAVQDNKQFLEEA